MTIRSHSVAGRPFATGLSAAFLVSALMLGPVTYTRAGLSDTAYERTSDKLSDCRPVVQEAIERYRKSLKDIHFTCANGSLQKLLVPRDAAILDQPPEAFASSNLALFISPLPKKQPSFAHMSQFDSKLQSTAYETFGGFKIWDAVAFRRRPVEIDGKFKEGRYGMFHVQLVDTSGWHFKPHERVKCDRAVGLARSYDSQRGAAREHYSCQNWPQIVLHSCAGGPGLVQFVGAFDHNDIRNNGESLFVDAETGKVCVAQFR